MSLGQLAVYEERMKHLTNEIDRLTHEDQMNKKELDEWRYKWAEYS